MPENYIRLPYPPVRKNTESGNEIPLVSHLKCIIALHSAVNILSVPKSLCTEKSMELLEKVCPEKTRLLNAYQEAAMAHSTAMARLRYNMRTLKKEGYEAAYADTERLRMASRLAQEALSCHLAGHGC